MNEKIPEQKTSPDDNGKLMEDLHHHVRGMLTDVLLLDDTLAEGREMEDETRVAVEKEMAEHIVAIESIIAKLPEEKRVELQKFVELAKLRPTKPNQAKLHSKTLREMNALLPSLSKKDLPWSTEKWEEKI